MYCCTAEPPKSGVFQRVTISPDMVLFPTYPLMLAP
jgi:hypothetical protein